MRLVVIFATSLCFNQFATAHQNPNWFDPLMNNLDREPATIMDIGFLRADLKLQPVATFLKMSASAGMDVTNQQFGIALQGWSWDALSTYDDAKSLCKTFVERVRLLGSIDVSTGLPRNEYSAWATLFDHVAYSKPELDGTKKALDQRITVKCNARYAADQELKMTAPLLGKDIFIRE